MTATAAGSHLEFDCAHGDTAIPLSVDGRNVFNVSGTFVREHGGPIQVGAVPDAHPAIYSGSIAANTMVLSVMLTDTPEMIGTFTLIKDVPGRVLKCLLPLSQ